MAAPADRDPLAAGTDEPGDPAERTSPPTMPGPTGDTPMSTESIGDPHADDPGGAVAGGAATGAALGTLVGGPIGLAAGAAIGALGGAVAGADRDGAAGPADPADSADPAARERRPAPSPTADDRGLASPAGDRATSASDDVPVIDALTEMTEGRPDGR
jgi:hypothetical protein